MHESQFPCVVHASGGGPVSLSFSYVRTHCIASQGFTVISHSVEGFGFPAEDAQGRRAAEPEKPLRRRHWPDKGKAGGVQLCKKEFYP